MFTVTTVGCNAAQAGVAGWLAISFTACKILVSYLPIGQATWTEMHAGMPAI